MTDTPFFGRTDELAKLYAELLNPRGAAILVVGQPGMGKTKLLDRLIINVVDTPELKCGVARFEVTQSDSVDSILGILMDRMYDAAQITEGSFEPTPRRTTQMRALLNVVGIGDLVMSLRRDPARNTRDQFLAAMDRISDKMSSDRRAVFCIDPEKYLIENSDQDWAIVIRGLPPKVKLIFAQRPDDQLAHSQLIELVPNAVRIPKGELTVLDAQGFDDLVKTRAVETGMSYVDLQKLLEPYHHHPYAVSAAVELLAAGTKVEDLPNDAKPTTFADLQWRRICQGGCSGQNSELAIRLFQAYALLEFPVPNHVIESVSGLSSAQRIAVASDRYLGTLIRDEEGSQRIYHAIISDYIRKRTPKRDADQYHRQSIDTYRKLLSTHPPDGLAAKRLPKHVRAVEGDEAFLRCFLEDCATPLEHLGLFDEIEVITSDALQSVPPNSEMRGQLLNFLGSARRSRGDYEGSIKALREALDISEKLEHHRGMAITYNQLGIVMKHKRNLNTAEAMFRKALEVYLSLGRRSGLADVYGNLSDILRDRGDLNGAEDMCRRSLAIEEELGRPEGIANARGNLGNILMARGDIENAEAMFQEALAIDTKLGRLSGMANAHLAIGNVLRIKGDLKGAEALYRKALETLEGLGRPAGIAPTCTNLGDILCALGDLPEARDMWLRAQDFFRTVGAQVEIDRIQIRLDNLKD